MILKKIFLSIILLPVFLFAQENPYKDDLVTGVVTSDEGTFLVLENGYIQIEQNDIWKEYYQRIYKDTTISNPNTELKNGYSINIIPYIISSTEMNNKYNFDESIKFGLLFQLDKNKQYHLSKYGRNLLDSLQNAH